MQANIEQELKRLESTYWEAIQRKDGAAAMRLSDTSCVVVGAQGVGALDREKLGEMLKQANYELTRYQLDDKSFHVRKITDDVVAVAYGVREDLVVDGKAESLEAFDASVWVKRGNDWVCALHTESLKGDPFGRVNRDLLHDYVNGGESAKATVGRLLEAHRKHDVERAREVIAEDFVWHYGANGLPMKREDWLAGMEEGMRAFTDLAIEVVNMIAEGSKVAVQLAVTGRHTGMFQGISPTNKPIKFWSMWSARVANGRIAEVWMLDEDFVSKLRAAPIST